MNVVDELIVNGMSVKDKIAMVMVYAITEFWEDNGGMYETTNEVNDMSEFCIVSMPYGQEDYRWNECRDQPCRNLLKS